MDAQHSQAASDDRLTAMDGLLSRLDATSESLSKAVAHLTDIADRHLGTHPQAAETTAPSKQAPSAVPNGSIAISDDKLDVIGRSLDRLNHQIERLSNL